MPHWGFPGHWSGSQHFPGTPSLKATWLEAGLAVLWGPLTCLWTPVCLLAPDLPSV